MTESSRNPKDLAAARALIGALCEERLTTEQAARLEDLVRRSSEIRRMYIRLMHLHAGLYQHASLLGGRAVELDAESASAAGLCDAMVMPALPAAQPAPTLRLTAVNLPALSPSNRSTLPARRLTQNSPSGPRRLAWAAAAAVVLAIGLTIAMAYRHGRSERRPVQTAEGQLADDGTANARPPVAATLNTAFGAEWADGSTPAAGAGLSADRDYGLKAGYARLTFPGGVVVVIEGPARFTPRSGGEVTLASGKLAAVVPGTARGFTVRTAAATVVDLGTEFGVAASAAGTDVQVFRGKVSLAPAANARSATSGSPTAAAQVMSQGDARRVDAAGAVSKVAANPAAFIRVAQLDGWAAPGSPMLRWHAYSERLRRDPALVLYYSFEKNGDAPYRLQNDALLTFGRYDLTLDSRSPTWAQGRWPEKSALAFDASQHQHLLLSDYPLAGNGKISVAAWVYLRRRTTWAAMVKNRGNNKGGQFAMGLWGDDGDLVARGFCDNNTEVEVREGKSSPLPTHRWEHVAMVADGSALRLFHNGKEIAARACRLLAPNPSVRSLAIGFRTDDDGATPLPSANAENWDGSFDELAVFQRALTSEQVKEMFDAGKP